MLTITDDLCDGWELNEASGNAVASWAGHTLTDVNTVTSGTGIGGVGTARHFAAASNECLYCDDALDLHVDNGSFSVWAWINLDSTGTTRTIMAKYSAGLGPVGDTNEWALVYDAGGKARLVVDSSTTVDATTFGNLSTGTWYFICARRDVPAGKIYISVNNGAENEAAGHAVTSGAGQFMIGALGRNTGPVFPFDGYIARPGFCKRALTATQRTTLYAAGAGVAFPYETQAAPTFFGASATPTDNGSNPAPTATITPPADMVAGDLAVVFVLSRHRGDTGPTYISNNGGQAWSFMGTWEDDANGQGSSTKLLRAFWCTFNGTWAASPAFACLEGTDALTGHVSVYRSADATTYPFWAPDQWMIGASFSAPGGSHTATITGVRNVKPANVTVAAWAVDAANTWGSLTGTSWDKTGLTAQYRNTTGSDTSLTVAYRLSTSAGLTADVAQNESAATAGNTMIMSFTNLALPSGGSGARTFVKSAISLDAAVPTGDGITYTVSKAFASAVGVGNNVVGSLNFESTNNCRLVRITDDLKNDYIVHQAVNTNVFTQALIKFHAVNLTNAPQTITATIVTSGDPVGIHLVEFSGAATLNKYSGALALSSGVSPHTISPGAITTTGAGAFVYVVARTEGTGFPQPFWSGHTVWGGTLIDNQGTAGPPQIANRGQFYLTQSNAGAIDTSVIEATDVEALIMVSSFIGAAATVPVAPTIGTATAGNASASVTFTPGGNGGATITGYTATSTPGSITGFSATGSPITINGLSNGTPYTFTVHATNAIGNSTESAASNSVTPLAPSPVPIAAITLVDSSGNIRASLTGLKWAWFDQVTPDTLIGPTDQGTSATTDANGLFSQLLPNSSLNQLDVGWLMISDSDGTTSQSPSERAFSGPVGLI